MSNKPGFAISHNQLYVIQPSGSIFAYIPQFNRWLKLDGYSATSKITAANDHLYQMHTPDDSIWSYNPQATPQWIRIDGNTDTKSIAAGGDNVYQIHNDGQIYEYNAAGKKWDNIETFKAAVKIVADGDAVYQLHKEGGIYKFNGLPNGGWTVIDNNTDTVDVVVGAGEVYQQHQGGSVWKYNPGGAWKIVDNNPDTLQIAVGKAGLYQRHQQRIYKYDGTKWNAIKDAETADMVVGDEALYVRDNAGVVLGYKAGQWFGLAPVPSA